MVWDHDSETVVTEIKRISRKIDRFRREFIGGVVTLQLTNLKMILVRRTIIVIDSRSQSWTDRLHFMLSIQAILSFVGS